MNTCETCKHWKSPDRENTLYGICNAPSLDYEAEEKPDGASPEDTYRYHAYFKTGPKFGCIHHEPE